MSCNIEIVFQYSNRIQPPFSLLLQKLTLISIMNHFSVTICIVNNLISVKNHMTTNVQLNRMRPNCQCLSSIYFLVEQNSSSAISKIDQARLKMKNDYGQGCQNRLHQNATLQLGFYTLSYCMMVALLYKKPNHVFQSLMRTNEDKTGCVFRNKFQTLKIGEK